MDETACRVLAKERALRPAQHLDALDVEQLRIERTLVAEEHIVRVDGNRAFVQARRKRIALNAAQVEAWRCIFAPRSAEHTSELQSLMRHSYAVFCLKQKTKIKTQNRNT